MQSFEHAELKSRKSNESIFCFTSLQGFKSKYFHSVFDQWSEAQKTAHKELPATSRSLNFRSPLDSLFWFAIANNVAAIFGLAGVLAAQRVGEPAASRPTWGLVTEVAWPAHWSRCRASC